jgi:SAM-dependent methyltransferase
VEHYARYRPGYPPEIIDLLKTSYGLSPNSLIADIGSGTGKLTELFLQNGNSVFGVEPNAAMRQAAEKILGGNARFTSINGSAESSHLMTNSIDFVAAGQAFHWFDQPRTRKEFARILKPRGWVVIVWNARRLESSQFLRDYEKLLLEFGTDYREVRHERVADGISQFFGQGKVTLHTFENLQEFDFEGLKGRLSSTSYTPEPGTEAFLTMLEALRRVFSNHSSAGKVVLEYDTRVYCGQLE